MKYPYRIEFTPIALLDQKSWKAEAVDIRNVGVMYYRGINKIMQQQFIDKLKTFTNKLMRKTTN